MLTSDSGTSDKKQFIEIWDRQRRVKNYDLAALDVHGDVYTDCKKYLQNFFSVFYFFN